MYKINKDGVKFTGAVVAGLFTGLLVGYIVGVNRKVVDKQLLSSWVKDCGEYEDGNVFGYETGLPEGFHDKPAKKLPKPPKGSIK